MNDKVSKAYSILGVVKRNFIYLDKDFWFTVQGNG